MAVNSCFKFLLPAISWIFIHFFFSSSSQAKITANPAVKRKDFITKLSKVLVNILRLESDIVNVYELSIDVIQYNYDYKHQSCMQLLAKYLQDTFCKQVSQQKIVI